MPSTIPTPPISLDWPPLGGRWFHWREIEACFWRGGDLNLVVEPKLKEIKDYGGVYLLAWSMAEPSRKRSQQSPAVKYIGETHCFKDRMGGFGNSAGFWGIRKLGHSAGWSWPEGRNENLWVAFFDVAEGADLEAHVAQGLRRWVEGVALEEYRLTHGTLPQVNTVKRNEVVEF